MKSRQEGSQPRSTVGVDSLFLLAEELKQPLIAITHASEQHDHEAARLQAERALRTLDAIILGEQLASGQVELDLQPLHIGSVMVDVQQRLAPALKQRSIDAELSLRRGLALIDTDKRVVSSILTSLWQIMLSSVGSAANVTFTAKGYKGGIRVAISSPEAQLDGLNAPRISPQSAQPLKDLAGSGGDFLAATQLAELLGTKLTTSKRSIGVLLPKSSQLSLV